MDELLQLLADQVVGCPAEDTRHRRADPFDDGLAGEQHNVAGVLGEEPEALLAGGQRLGGAEMLEPHLDVSGQVDQQLEGGRCEGVRQPGRDDEGGTHLLSQLERDGDRRTQREGPRPRLPRIELGALEVVDLDLHRARSQAPTRRTGVGGTGRPVGLQGVDLSAVAGSRLDGDRLVAVVVVVSPDPDQFMVGIGDEGVTDVLQEPDVVGRPDEDAHGPPDGAQPVHLGVGVGGLRRRRDDGALVKAVLAARGRRHVRRCRLSIHAAIVGPW